MASSTNDSSSASHLTPPAIADVPTSREMVASVLETVQWIIRPLTSLKITVTLLTLSIFIILFGTLAQVDMDMWEVITVYFRSSLAWIDIKVLFPRTWFPNAKEMLGVWYTRSFPFPGGATIGALLALNLFSAGITATIAWVLTNVLRSKKKPNWLKMIGGLGTLAVGAAITTAIIWHGHNHEGLQGDPPLSWETLWACAKGGLFLAFVGSVVALVVRLIRDARQIAELILLGIASIVLGAVSIFLLIPGNDSYVGDPGMRILWQLIQSTFAATVMLLGFLPLFGKRSGVALLHSGVALMMFGQFFVGRYDVEEMMVIHKGDVTNYAQDSRKVELTIADGNNPNQTDKESVVAVPLCWMGRETHFLTQTISDAALPFDLKVVKFFKNSDVQLAQKPDEKVATAGRLKDFVAVERRKGSGTDMSSKIDSASAYVELFKKGTNESLGIYLVSQIVKALRDGTEFPFDDKVEFEGKQYDLALGLQRNYKPYSVELQDVRRENYLGTTLPRDYTSVVHLVDSRFNVDRKDIRIWMNNPLRYAGETFYQSSQDPEGKEYTVLQVVRNSGWMIPYVACMYVVVGMFYHFVEMLIRFLRRQSASAIMGYMGAASLLNPFASILLWILWTFNKPSSSSAKPAAGTDSKSPARPKALAPTDMWGITVPACTVLMFASWFLYSAKAPREPQMLVKDPAEAKDEHRSEKLQVFNIFEFGKLPVIADGRVKPFDTLARNTLRVLSGREDFREMIEVVPPAKDSKDPHGTQDKSATNDKDSKTEPTFIPGKKLPAIRWLLDVISDSAAIENHRVFRIDNPEVLETLGLEKREGFLYSLKEILKNYGEFQKQSELAHERQQEKEKDKNAEGLSVYQRKILEVEAKFNAFSKLRMAFHVPGFPRLPTVDELRSEDPKALQAFAEFRRSLAAFTKSLERTQAPLSVPVRSAESKKTEWQPYSKAWIYGLIDVKLVGRNPEPALIAMDTILNSYASGDAEKFNNGIREYHKILNDINPSELVLRNTITNNFVESGFGSFYGFEAFFNRLAPFYHADVMYVCVFVLAAASWLGFRRPLNGAALWLLLFTFAVHTVAIVARIYISGRPPVTNLYSSAVFIGWGGVLAGLVIEMFIGMSIGNVVAAAFGFSTLFIAHNLAADGDTFTVLQAVLDTQFWLATHVVCITLGYAATFLAGMLGLFYILGGVFSPALTPELRKELVRMTYGTICFAIFFSFFGTVLGGLWADDSWGRFWGWDPKENGALIIVLWNAVVLHARWGGLVKERGLAALAVVGNIVTAWSWFGVNELGVGLHTYGFTDGRLMALRNYVLFQMLIVAISCLPLSCWWSYRKHGMVVAQVTR